MSHSDNDVLDRSYYEDIDEKSYLKNYDDNPTNKPLFALINHIGIKFKDGICPARFLEKINRR